MMAKMGKQKSVENLRLNSDEGGECQLMKKQKQKHANVDEMVIKNICFIGAGHVGRIDTLPLLPSYPLPPSESKAARSRSS
jgi:hypothetical protein